MKLVISHLTGNANVKGAVNGFIAQNLLAEFYVSMGVFSGSFLDNIGNLKPFSEIKRRRFDPAVKPFIRSWPWYEIGRLLATRAGLSNLTDPHGMFHIDSVCKNFDNHVASRLKTADKNIGGIYCYEDIAEYSFTEAKKLGLKRIYDLPIGYWRAARRILDPEKEKWPEWASTMTGLTDSDEKLMRKDKELALADLIFVASTFSASTLKEYQGNLPPVKVVPYGFPEAARNRDYSVKKNGAPLKLLYVGSLSQRKGIANLFAAVDSLKNNVELTLVGNKRSNDCVALDQALSRHKWFSSLSHNDILALMRNSDVLVFPSLFEGFGLVITEAMSQGTPVITTDRTAGPDFIVHDQNGWLIEAGSTEAIKSSIENLLSNPALIKKAGQEAMQTARQRSWAMYQQELSAEVDKFLRV
jgi:glycosyltransferase involved in cell wall biosynthesis